MLYARRTEELIYSGAITGGASYAIHRNFDRHIPTVYSKDKSTIITTNDPKATASCLSAVRWILSNACKVMKEGGNL